MYEIMIAIMSVFAVLGVINILSGICTHLLRKGTYGKITIYVESEAGNLEGDVRSLLLKNPTAEIVIKDTGEKERVIVERLERDNPRIHLE